MILLNGTIETKDSKGIAFHVKKKSKAGKEAVLQALKKIRAARNETISADTHTETRQNAEWTKVQDSYI